MQESSHEERLFTIEKEPQDYNFEKEKKYYFAFYHEGKIRVRNIKIIKIEEKWLENIKNPIEINVFFKYTYETIAGAFSLTNKCKEKSLESTKPIKLIDVSRSELEAKVKMGISILNSKSSSEEEIIQAKVNLFEQSLRNQDEVKILISQDHKYNQDVNDSIKNIFIHNKEDVKWTEGT